MKAPARPGARTTAAKTRSPRTHEARRPSMACSLRDRTERGHRTALPALAVDTPAAARLGFLICPREPKRHAPDYGANFDPRIGPTVARVPHPAVAARQRSLGVGARGPSGEQSSLPRRCEISRSLAESGGGRGQPSAYGSRGLEGTPRAAAELRRTPPGSFLRDIAGLNRAAHVRASTCTPDRTTG